jgi:hypothetical protein
MDKIKKYCDNPEFCDFVFQEFESTASNSTIEELAEFAFGDIQEAIKGFEERNKIKG